MTVNSLKQNNHNITMDLSLEVSFPLSFKQLRGSLPTEKEGMDMSRATRRAIQSISKEQ